MARLAYLGSIALVALACATLPACGQQDETQRILAQCTNPPPDQIDSCIEQVRVQQETDPSPDLKGLLGALIKRQVEAQNAPRDLQPLPPPPDDGSDPNAYEAPPAPPVSTDMDGGTYEPPPDAPPQDVVPPAEQGDPADADQGDTDTPPPPPAGEQNPTPQNGGGPGRA